jgi:ferredoxin
MAGDNLNVYELLAKKLDAVPPGFPRSEDGHSEVRLLRWIFEPVEAEVMLGVSPEPETAQTIAERLTKPVAEVETILNLLYSHGCLLRVVVDGQARYNMTPMIPGLQEPQFWRQDKTPEEIRQFAELWEDYYPTFVAVGSYGPAVGRIVPISQAIEAIGASHPLEDVHALVEQAKSVVAVPCPCRDERRLTGHACSHSSQVCLLLSTVDGLQLQSMDVGKVLTKEEAHRILEECAAEGLIHETFNAGNAPAYFICNCCSCCCVLLRAAKEFNMPHMVVSDFTASISQPDCVACGICADKRCKMDAIEEVAGEYCVIAARCIGCGVCVIGCPTKAIRLTRKSVTEPLPASMPEWAMQRMSNRPDTM